MGKLITASLISSIEFTKTAPPSWAEKAYKDLWNQLARVPWKEVPDYVQRGFDFEDKVQKIVTNGVTETVKCSDTFREICRECVGGKFQVTTKSNMKIDDIVYTLYGKIDNKQPDCILDIKTTGKFKETKYTESIQHMIYCHNEKMKYFKYLVALFNEQGKLYDHVVVPVTIDDFQELEVALRERIREALQFLKEDNELWELYMTKFNKY